MSIILVADNTGATEPCYTGARLEWDALAVEIMDDPDFIQARYPLTLFNAGGFDVSTQTTTGGNTQSITATMLEFEQGQFDGANIKIGDKKALVRNCDLSYSVLDGITSFIYDLTDGGMSVFKGKVIGTSTDPMGVTSILHLRS